MRPDAFSRMWPERTWTEIRPSVWWFGDVGMGPERREDHSEVVVLQERSGILPRVPRRLTVKAIDFRRQVEFEKRTRHRRCVGAPMGGFV